MRMKRFASVLAVIASAGCASTATSPAVEAGTAVTAKTTTTAGTTHILLYSINSDGPKFQAILTGTIGDFGQAVSINPDGTINPDHTSELDLKLTLGSFRTEIAGLDQKIVSAYRHWPSNPGTCSGSIAVTAATPIVAGSGTGAYRGIGGTFEVTATIDEVDTKPVCNGTSAFRAQVIIIAGPGNVSYR